MAASNNISWWYGWDAESGKCTWYPVGDNIATIEANEGTNFQTHPTYPTYPISQDAQNLMTGANGNRQVGASYATTPLASNAFSQSQWGRTYASDVPMAMPSSPYPLMNPPTSYGLGGRSSSIKRSRSSAPQRTRSQEGGETLIDCSGFPNYTSPRVQAQYGYPTHMSSNGHSQWLSEDTQPMDGYAPPLQGVIASSTNYNSHQRLRGGQSQRMANRSTMQELLDRRLRDTAPSTLTSSTDASAISGSTGGTFSSVSSNISNDPSDFRRRPDIYQVSRLGHQLNQLQITGNAAELAENMEPFPPLWPIQEGHENGGYGQMRARMTTRPDLPQGPNYGCACDCARRVHSCSSSQLPLHRAQYSSHGENHPTIRIQIGYCPILDCNRGPGSRRPFPRTCNLLEHLRGVHKKEIPKGAKLKDWLIEEGYDPDLLVATARSRP